MADIGTKTFLASITNKIFKILVLKEGEARGEEVFLCDYIDSIASEVRGARLTFPTLGADEDYITVTNVMQDMCVGDYELRKTKREVLKMCSLLNKIADRVGDDNE